MPFCQPLSALFGHPGLTGCTIYTKASKAIFVSVLQCMYDKHACIDDRVVTSYLTMQGENKLKEQFFPCQAVC